MAVKNIRQSIKILLLSVKKPNKAFTLVEVIVILFVISVGLIGVLSLIVQNIQSQNLNKNSSVVYQLAQEGLELIRNVRDSNWIAGNSWNKNLAPGEYYMDYQNLFPNPLISPDQGNLYQDSNGYFFHNSIGTPTVFRRILLIKNNDLNSVRIKSSVFWFDRGRSFSYELETLLYDWR